MKYEGYSAKVEWDAEEHVLHGTVEGSNDLITFQVAGPEEIETAFREAVDRYLSLCEELGKEPDRKQTTYLARVQRTNDGWFAIDFPDLPGTHAQCHSLYEIQAEAHHCLRSYLDAARMLDMDIPKPSKQVNFDELAEGMMIVAVTA